MTDRRVIECNWDEPGSDPHAAYAPKEFVVMLRLRAPAERNADAVAEQIVSFLNDDTAYEVDRCEAVVVVKLTAAELATRPGRRGIAEPLLALLREGAVVTPDAMRIAMEPVGEAMFATGDKATFGELVAMFIEVRGREDFPAIFDFIEGWILRAAEVHHAQ